ncbi:MAG: ion transporter [bacterium]|nr:ion transporter [bacterium]
MSSQGRRRIFEILDRGGSGDLPSRICDGSLMVLIVLSVTAAVLESVPEFALAYGSAFATFEFVSVMIFSVEYVLRVATIVEGPNPRFQSPVLGRLRYMASPIAVTDLVAFFPFYLTAFINIDLRMLRVLRLIRIFKLAHYFSALNVLLDVIRIERHAFSAAYFVVVVGMLMASSGVYVFEHEAQPEVLGSIPEAMWWAVATLTTVGYGDVTPVTFGGKVFGTFVMVLGVGIVAVPTGILATGFALELRRRREHYYREVLVANEDGEINETERAHLEEVRSALDLDRSETNELEHSPIQLAPPLIAPMTECPHCGEQLADQVKQALPEVDP